MDRRGKHAYVRPVGRANQYSSGDLVLVPDARFTVRPHGLTYEFISSRSGVTKILIGAAQLALREPKVCPKDVRNVVEGATPAGKKMFDLPKVMLGEFILLREAMIIEYSETITRDDMTAAKSRIWCDHNWAKAVRTFLS